MNKSLSKYLTTSAHQYPNTVIPTSIHHTSEPVVSDLLPIKKLHYISKITISDFSEIRYGDSILKFERTNEGIYTLIILDDKDQNIEKIKIEAVNAFALKDLVLDGSIVYIYPTEVIFEYDFKNDDVYILNLKISRDGSFQFSKRLLPIKVKGKYFTFGESNCSWYVIGSMTKFKFDFQYMFNVMLMQNMFTNGVQSNVGRLIKQSVEQFKTKPNFLLSLS